MRVQVQVRMQVLAEVQTQVLDVSRRATRRAPTRRVLGEGMRWLVPGSLARHSPTGGQSR